jgi:hypothetical protein
MSRRLRIKKFLQHFLFLFDFSVSNPGQPYLSTLSAQDLETLGLKAVAAGAEPTKLQQVNNQSINKVKRWICLIGR